MIDFSFCGLGQVACLSARAVGRKSEAKLVWIIAGIAAFVAFLIYQHWKYLTQKSQNENLGTSPTRFIS